MTRREVGISLVIVFVACAWKLIWLSMDVFPFNADEAIVALMARHILSGARPIFFYGQAYMGSVDAYLVSALFGVMGQTVLAIRITQLILYAGTIITTIAVGQVAFGSIRAGWLAGLILAVPTVNLTLYTTVSLGGYGEALLIGNLVILLGCILYKRIQNGFPIRFWEYLSLGLLMGLGLWANGLTLIYSLPVSLALLIQTFIINKRIVCRMFSLGLPVLVGFSLGSLPWWIFAVQNGFQALITELLGNAVAVETASWLEVTGQHLVNLLLLGLPALFGIRPPWEVRWLALPLIPFILAFWVIVIVFFIRKTRTDFRVSFFPVLMSIGVVFLISFVATPFGVDPSGRYFLPLSVILALVAGQMLAEKESKKWQIAALALVIVFHGWGTWECAQERVPGITTQFDASTVIDTSRQAELIQFLKVQGETRGYTTYWVAYPLVFLSQEELIFTPRLPYHADLRYTARDDRYPVYSDIVNASDKAAFITTKQPELDQRLRGGFQKYGVKWKEEIIGDYRVFYALSRKITPSELDIYLLDVSN